MESVQHSVTSSDDFLDYGLSHGFGDLHFKVCKTTGMKAIIAIHSTKLGPSLGGCRFIRYPNTQQAIYDAMRLARGMSFKAALVNLPLGGGKSVIIEPATPYDREAYMHSFGKFINELGGRYITALDSGTQLTDMDIIGQHTPYVSSLSAHNGDPSPYTAQGVVKGIEAAVFFKLKRESLSGLHMAIQGLGHVGTYVAKHLHEMGVTLTVADVNESRVEYAVKHFGAHVATTDDIHKTPCDVLVPCALGGIVNDTTIAEFETPIIAGAANNQLAHTYHGQKLYEKGILYATDYVINAGGLVYAASKYFKTEESIVKQQLHIIPKTLEEIFRRSSMEHRATSDIADAMAEEKLK